MASDIVVALKDASASGATLFALNHHAEPNVRHRLVCALGQHHDAGDLVRTSTVAVPQVRQTAAILGTQPFNQWGLLYGVNEHRVALGVTEWASRLPGGARGLNGCDLVRLALERCHGAYHAIEILTDLLEHHAPEAGNDLIFLVADPREAFVLEASGRFWALLECGHSRVVTDTAMIRQDWRRLAPGLAQHVIEHGWWQDDGSKIDFVGCLSQANERSRNAQKRWGRASLALTQQQGAIDAHFLRRMMADHYAMNRELYSDPRSTTLACSFMTELPAANQPFVCWVSFGPPKVALHFPVSLAGEVPLAFCESLPEAASIEEQMRELLKLATGKEADRARLVQMLERLQTRFDQDAEELLARCHESAHGRGSEVGALATEMMHAHAELFAKENRRLFGVDQPGAAKTEVEEEVLFFA